MYLPAFNSTFVCPPQPPDQPTNQLTPPGVREQLHELFGIPKEAPCVLELDSSTPSKFSRCAAQLLAGYMCMRLDCVHACVSVDGAGSLKRTGVQQT